MYFETTNCFNEAFVICAGCLAQLQETFSYEIITSREYGVCSVCGYEIKEEEVE